jgi:hypothetical protein
MTVAGREQAKVRRALMAARGRSEPSGMRIWVVLTAVAIVVHGAGLWLLQARRGESEKRETVAIGSIAVLPSETGERSAVVRERLWLFDPEPLFLPTRWNFGETTVARRQEGQLGALHADYDPSWSFGGERLALRINSANSEIPSPLALIQGDGRAHFAGFGRRNTVAADPFLGPIVEVHRADTGELQLRERLEGASALGLAPGSEPLELMIAVSSFGVLGGPKSRFADPTRTGEDAEGWRRASIARQLRLGARLEPGVYRVVIGP